MNKIYLSEEEMEFILSYRKANSKDKEKVKEILKTEGDEKCLREETNASS
jgi:hypothetical protein